MKYEGTQYTHREFAEDTEILTGDSCYTIGNFSNYGLSYKEGDSGALLINSNYNVIEMITFRTKNNGGVVEQYYSYAISAERILFLT